MQITYSQRLIAARKSLNLSQRGFAKLLDVSHGIVSFWELGKSELSSVSARAIEHVFGISSDWLLTGEGEMMVSGSKRTSKQTEPESEVTPGVQTQILVPILSAMPCAGDGNTLDDYVREIDFMPFSEHWLRASFGVPPKNLCLLKVSGDSMMPTLNPDDLIFVDGLAGQPEYRDGIWVLRLDGQLFVKRVQKRGYGQYVITSDNPAYSPLDPDDSTALLGRVVGGPPRRF